MLLLRIYGLLWIFAGIAGGALYATNSFSTTAMIIYGFSISVLAGSYLLAVYPSLMSEKVSAAHSSGRS